jgi:biotin-(acetyl-CoA carboxylase) ligase
MKNKTQLNWVKQQLRQNGQISRNEALRNYISRLGAIILVLKKQGWQFETEWKEGDYIYKLKVAPVIRKIEIINGRAVEVVQQSKLL